MRYDSLKRNRTCGMNKRLLVRNCKKQLLLDAISNQ